VHRADLEAMGVPADGEAVTGDWFADPDHWQRLAARLTDEVARHRAEHPLEPGAPVAALQHRLGLPDRALVEALITPPLTLEAGRVAAGRPGVPGELVRAVDRAFAGKGDFAAPEAYELQGLGLGARQLAAAVRGGLVIQPAPQVVLRAGVLDRAAEVLAALPQPFTLSEARRALDTTRRVAVPLLELLDRRGVTERRPDDRRTIRPARA
jgi:selenocysteine-specific elongation factor